MDFKDYYKILGVDRNATLKDIKSTYRTLARKFHPDVNPGDKTAEATFGEINEAYEVLGNDEERKKYDEIADYVKAGGKPNSGRGGSPPGGGQYRAEDLEDLFGGGGDEGASFFEQFFGRRQGRAAPRKGADIHAEVTVALKDLLHGSTRRLSLERAQLCSQCQGSGIVGQNVCPTCRGRGQVVAPQTLEVKIPSGVTQGSTIRLQGQGQVGSAGAPAGDLLLQIALEDDPVYQVEGHDLRREAEVPVLTAILGGEVTFEGLRGNLSLKLPPDTQNGRVFRLREQGLPRSRPAATPGGTPAKPSGDLYVKVSLRIPTALTPEQRELFKALKDKLDL